MGFAIKQVLVPTCDGCGALDQDPDTSTSFHYDTRDEFLEAQKGLAVDDDPAEAYYYSWSVEGEVLTCPACRRKEYCKANGHTRHESAVLKRGPYCLVCNTDLGVKSP